MGTFYTLQYLSTQKHTKDLSPARSVYLPSSRPSQILPRNEGSRKKKKIIIIVKHNKMCLRPPVRAQNNNNNNNSTFYFFSRQLFHIVCARVTACTVVYIIHNVIGGYVYRDRGRIIRQCLRRFSRPSVEDVSEDPLLILLFLQ